jgi:GTP-binding protein YchF
MNLKIGIVGLPNVGKSTLFNALTKSENAAAENFPFCTIDPNVGIVEVPDKRVNQLADIVQPEKVIRSIVEFVDIAGLVEGASQGEGLGNKFLSHIRECNAICHVLRDFEDTNIHHVNGKVDPKSDLEIILTELILADLESVQKQMERVSKKAKTGDKESKKEFELLEQYESLLTQGKLAITLELTNEDDKKFAKQFQLLTNKPFIIVANTSEADFANFDESAFRAKIGDHAEIPIVPICAKVEAELADLDDEEAQLFLEELGAQKSGLESLIQKGFELLKLQSYFTAGPKEVRSWTIRIGDTAPQAAGAIHTDFEKGFIRAETIAFDDYIACGGETAAKEKGKMRTEGKEYVVQDGDVMHFRFNT